MERVIFEFGSHGKRLLVPNMSRTVHGVSHHSLWGGTSPIYLKSGTWEEACPGLKCEDISVWAWKSKLQDIYLFTFFEKSGYLLWTDFHFFSLWPTSEFTHSFFSSCSSPEVFLKSKLTKGFKTSFQIRFYLHL